MVKYFRLCIIRLDWTRTCVKCLQEQSNFSRLHAYGPRSMRDICYLFSWRNTKQCLKVDRRMYSTIVFEPFSTILCILSLHYITIQNCPSVCVLCLYVIITVTWYALCSPNLEKKIILFYSVLFYSILFYTKRVV